MPVRIDDLLRVAISHGASDLHLKVAAFPVMRIGGELHTIADAPRLKPEDTLDMAFTIMSNRQKQRFKEVFEADIAYGLRSPHSEAERIKISRQRFPATGFSEHRVARYSG